MPRVSDHLVKSAIRLVRQSTTVPNTSNTSAFTAETSDMSTPCFSILSLRDAPTELAGAGGERRLDEGNIAIPQRLRCCALVLADRPDDNFVSPVSVLNRGGIFRAGGGRH